jgi:hypothetical protein
MILSDILRRKYINIVLTIQMLPAVKGNFSFKLRTDRYLLPRTRALIDYAWRKTFAPALSVVEN